MLQQRVPGTPDTKGSVWVDPMRDIAHAFPQLIGMALKAMESELKNSHVRLSIDMGKYAQALAKFIKGCADPLEEGTVVDLMRKLDLYGHPKDVQQLFGKWLTRVMLGFYFDGLRNALHPGEKQTGMAELQKIVDTMTTSIKEGSTTDGGRTDSPRPTDS